MKKVICRKFNIILSVAIVLGCMFGLASCGKKKNNDDVHYEVVNGIIMEVHGNEVVGAADGSETEKDPSAQLQETVPVQQQDDYDVAAQHGVGEYDFTSVSDGTAVEFPDEEYNSISKADSVKLEKLKENLKNAAQACKEIYVNADKGEGFDVSLSSGTVGQMINALGEVGYSAIDYNGDYNMSAYEIFEDFCGNIVLNVNCSGTYYVVYPDGHISLFNLFRESGSWHLISMSLAWNDDCSTRIYSEGRYALGTVKYTNKGWLIYSRNTTDFDANQKANTDSYTMIRVKPYDANCKALAAKYVEPVGYFENNLFITNWSQDNFIPIDFNSLYAYLFGMYNGTQSLSSYNVRNYYKSIGGTRLYLIPEESFEKTVTYYFNIDVTLLKGISDYNSSLNSYFFLGYNRDYYTVTPRTPKPEVVDYVTNTDGSITMTVDAVNPWYGTDCAFRHKLTVMPWGNGSFKYVSNTLIDDVNNILPQQKLAEMLDVERSKTDY